MRKIFTLITVAMATVSFSACTVSIDSKPSEESTESTESASASPKPSESPSVNNDERYADFLREEAPELAGVSTGTLMGVTESACDALDTGATLEELILTSMPSGLSPETVGTILGGAIAYECPEHEDALNSASSL